MCTRLDLQQYFGLLCVLYPFLELVGLSAKQYTHLAWKKRLDIVLIDMTNQAGNVAVTQFLAGQLEAQVTAGTAEMHFPVL